MKNKNRVSILLIVATISIVIPACKKDNDDNKTVKSKTELLTTGTWKRTALSSTPAYDWNGDGTFDTNLLNTMKACEKDNFETYNINGTVETNEGGTKCNPMDPQTWVSTWIFSHNETKLIFNGNDEYILTELTATSLKFQSTFVENGVTYTHYESYGH